MKAVKYIVTDSVLLFNKELAGFLEDQTKNGAVIAIRILNCKQNNEICDMALDGANKYRRADGQYLYNGRFVKAETVQNAFLAHSRKVEVYQVENTNGPIVWLEPKVWEGK